MNLDVQDKALLLKAARASIEYGVKYRTVMPCTPSDYSQLLQEKRATFVTLHRNQKLRGCIGILEAMRPLIEDVIFNAHAAAFRDTRFLPLAAKELEGLDIEISILSPHEEISFESEADLLSKIRPGTDGLILEDGFSHGLFLPQMWEQLPEPAEFMHHLKLKAGLAPTHWSDSVKVSRFTVEVIH